MDEHTKSSGERYLRLLNAEIERLTGGIGIDPAYGHVSLERWTPDYNDQTTLYAVWRCESLWACINEALFRKDRRDCFRVAFRCYASAREYHGRLGSWAGCHVSDALRFAQSCIERLVGDKEPVS